MCRRDTGRTNNFIFIMMLKDFRRYPASPCNVQFVLGEAAQVDFRKGPEVLDPRTGQLLSTWIFVMTLVWSRHAYAEVVTDQKVATWLGCHRRAFEWGGRGTCAGDRRARARDGPRTRDSAATAAAHRA